MSEGLNIEVEEKFSKEGILNLKRIIIVRVTQQLWSFVKPEESNRAQQQVGGEEIWF
jgi:hypothetical protein